MHLQGTPSHSASPTPWTATGERRQAARTVLERLAYIAIGADNGGIVLNVSDGGLGFHSIAPVQRGQPVRFSVTEHNRRMEADAEVVWADMAGTTGGLRFKRLPNEVRREIRAWSNLQEQIADITTEHVPLPRQPGRTVASASNTHGVDRGMRVRVRLSGFARGLMTGFGIATLLAAGLLMDAYQRELGQLLIRFGQRLAGSPQTPTHTARTAASLPEPPSRIPAKAALISAGGPARASAKDQEDDFLTILPKRVAPTVSDTTPEAPRMAHYVRSSGVHSPLAPKAPLAEGLPTSRLAVPRGLMLDHATLPQLSAPARLTEESKTTDVGPPPKLFFEVGKFRKETIAQQTRAKLAALGLPTSILQQGHLWMSSFHLLVGPYGDESEAHAASRALVSNGFKPRPFERGSRDFAFGSRLTVNDMTMAAGECVVKWESYIPTAVVKFVQGDDVVATASGMWEQRAARFERNAIVYQGYPDGRHVLIEIQFAGMDRALVFTKS